MHELSRFILITPILGVCLPSFHEGLPSAYRGEVNQVKSMVPFLIIYTLYIHQIHIIYHKYCTLYTLT